MANIFFLKPFLTALQEGRSVRFGIFILLWVIAIAVIVGGIVNWIDFWNQVSGQDAAGVFGVIFYQLIYLVLLYFLFQILVIRASDVLNVEAFDSDFTVIPVMSVLTRAFGELLAVIFVFLGFGGLIIAWFSGYLPFSSSFGFFGMIADSGFKGGILMLVAGIIQAFAAIVVAYFWAECIILGLKMYLNIKKIRNTADGYGKEPAPIPAPEPSKPPTDEKKD
jgi:hypothetical protein